MRERVVLFLHLLTTIARLAGPGGARAVVAESVLVKHQCSSSIGPGNGHLSLRLSPSHGRRLVRTRPTPAT